MVLLTTIQALSDDMVFPSIETTLKDVSSEIPGPCRFLFKCEYEQPSGSFKLRGMSLLIAQAIEAAEKEGKEHVEVYSSSGGNAGMAAALAASKHSKKCTVVLPKTTKQTSIDKLKDFGATVVVQGSHWGEADRYLRESIIDQLDQSKVYPVYCPPFDHPTLWKGHADLVDEIAEQLPSMNISPSKVKGIVLSVGGGGLYNGVVEGLARNSPLEHVPILAVETHQTPTFNEALKAGKVVVLDKIETLVSCLASPYISQKSLENYKNHPTTACMVDDLEALAGAVDFYDAFRDLVEPACGATICAATRRQDLLAAMGELQKDDVIVFVACGGAGVSLESLQEYRTLLRK